MTIQNTLAKDTIDEFGLSNHVNRLQDICIRQNQQLDFEGAIGREQLFNRFNTVRENLFGVKTQTCLPKFD